MNNGNGPEYRRYENYIAFKSKWFPEAAAVLAAACACAAAYGVYCVLDAGGVGIAAYVIAAVTWAVTLVGAAAAIMNIHYAWWRYNHDG